MKTLLRLSILGSGSSGNSTLISTGKTNVLIDAGFSCTEILSRLERAGIGPAALDGIVVTHEHTDHIKGLAVLLKRLGIPLYITKGSWNSVENTLGKHVQDLHTFSSGEGFTIDDISFKSFPVLHDASEPVGYCIYYEGIKIGIATDLGKATNLVRESLKCAHCLILESNHDTGMLYRGPYPWWLKQRIKGRFGHLSNEDSALLLEGLLHDDLRHVVMAHISQTNNQMEMVHLNAFSVLQKNDCGHVGLHMALQDRMINPIDLI